MDEQQNPESPVGNERRRMVAADVAVIIDERRRVYVTRTELRLLELLAEATGYASPGACFLALMERGHGARRPNAIAGVAQVGAES